MTNYRVGRWSGSEDWEGDWVIKHVVRDGARWGYDDGGLFMLNLRDENR